VRRSDAAARLVLAALAALIAFSNPLPVRAADPPPAKSVDQVERELKEARERERRLAGEAAAQVQAIEALRAQLSAAALATQESEEDLSAVESRLAGLDAEALARSAELERRRADLASLLSALSRLARNPPEAMLLMPSPPLDTVRAARLLGDAVPPIEAQAREVASEVAELQSLRDRVAAEREAAAAATQRLADHRETLRALVARRAELYEQAETAHAEAAQQIEALARQAADLRDLLHRLDENRAAPPPPRADSLQARVTDGLAQHLRRLGEGRGQMAFPARGRVLLAYGQAGDGGQPARGLTIETRPGAEVVAPYDGKIVFAGPFRGYGGILIIEHGEGYHTLLAGLGRIDVSVGQLVATGEPVGTASSPNAAGPPDVSAPADIYSKGAAGPVLYVELRRHGQPINPLPWLATSNGKVSG
jgi:murein hydrolase activator